MTRSNRRRPRIGLPAVLLLMGTVVAMLWALQRQLIYFPDPKRVPPAAHVIAGACDVTLHSADGLELGAGFVPAAGPSPHLEIAGQEICTTARVQRYER